MKSAHIYSPALHGRHWLFLPFSASLLFLSLQAVNPYKGTTAVPVNHAVVLETNKSSRDKDSTYTSYRARCICWEMESAESLLKKMQRSGKWIWCVSALMYIDCRSLLSWPILFTVSLSQRLFLHLQLLLSVSTDRDQQKEVNDELLKRITDNKAQPPARNFRVERSSRSIPITDESQPFEVHAWLNAKGFSRPWVTRVTL